MTATCRAAPTRRGAGAPGRRWLVLTGLLAVGVLVGVLVAGGGRPRSAPAGLPDAGPVTGWGLPLVRLAGDLLGVLAVGFLAAPAVLLPSSGDRLSAVGRRCCRVAAVLAGLWCAAALVQIVLTASDFAGLPPREVLRPALLAHIATEFPQGRALLIQAVLAAAVAGVAGVTAGARTFHAAPSRVALVGLLGALAALAPPALAGHSGAADDHMLATSSLLVHLVAAALWVGGLAALVAVARWAPPLLPAAVPRFSSLALWCLVAVGLSGAANALVRLGGLPALVSTGYGRLVLAKAFALGVLAAFGWAHRRRSLPALGGQRPGRAFARLAAVEVAVMVATIALAVGLARTPPPVPESPDVTASAARVLLGYSMPPPVTVGRLLFDVRPDGFFLTGLGLAAALYVTGLRVLRRRGHSWPATRTLCWFAGLAVVLIVTNGGIARYAPVLFSVHMAQHMALNMLAPILLVLGAPVTLALRTLPARAPRGGRSPRKALLGLVHSRPLQVLSHPLPAAFIFVSSLYGLYFSGIFEQAMRNHWGHLAMQVHFLAAGTLFFWVIVGIDPAPLRLPHIARLPLLLIVMVFHAFFGVALLSGTRVIGQSYYEALQRPWGGSLLNDQQLGGGIAWSLGEPVTLLVLLAVMAQWVRADQREARRLDRAADRAERRAAERAASGAAAPLDETDELAVYNARLAALHRRTQQGTRR